MLQTEITNADRQLGRAIQKMCERPETMTRQEALRFIEDHRDELEVAFQGTTLAMAVVHVEHRLLWTAGLGNSTVAISTHTSDRIRPQAEKLCDIHTLRDSQEYSAVSSSHPDETIADKEMRVLGLSEVTRAIGNFHLKLPRDYLEYLFQYLPHTGPGGTPLKDYVSSIRSPPYISSRPSVRFVDLEPRWRSRPFLMLFTDGVDRLVDGSTVFNPGVHSGADPADVVASILFDKRGAFSDKLEAALGHKVDYRWDDVRANAIIGNLLGGADVERLERVLAAQSMEPAGDGRGVREAFRIDDTSLILCDLKYLYAKCANSAVPDKARSV
ncbi:hypothetical protein C8Q80DRAFT_626240 [Daedaleopsis nitida]|nr:hypothetical protein C8Q80DRAFT_626240 [Daedaleopsis nitida]